MNFRFSRKGQFTTCALRWGRVYMTNWCVCLNFDFDFDYSCILQCDCACVRGCPCLTCACVCVWKGHREFGVWKMDRKYKIVSSHSFCSFVLLIHLCNSCCSNCTSCCLLCKPEWCLINLEILKNLTTWLILLTENWLKAINEEKVVGKIHPNIMFLKLRSLRDVPVCLYMYYEMDMLILKALN